MENLGNRRDEQAFQAWLTERLSEQLPCPGAEIVPGVPFYEYGMDSVACLGLCGEIEEEFGLRLEPTVVWDHPTLDGLARHLAAVSGRRQPHEAR